MALSVSSRSGAKSEINVTPLVDVCLVLLIIFMVLVPRTVPETSIRIPPERQPQARERPPAEDALVVGMTTTGALSLDRRPIERPALAAQLQRQLAFRDPKVVFVDIEGKVPYGDAVALVDLAKRSGAEVVAVLKKKDDVVPQTLRGF